MYNKNNYYTNSRGDFKQVSPAVVRSILHDVDWNEGSPRLPVAVQIGNHSWTLNFVSRSAAGSISVYYISEDESRLLRISDHWSRSKVKATNCGYIKSCFWRLIGKPYCGYSTKNHDRKFFGGIIPFAELF